MVLKTQYGRAFGPIMKGSEPFKWDPRRPLEEHAEYEEALNIFRTRNNLIFQQLFSRRLYPRNPVNDDTEEQRELRINYHTLMNCVFVPFWADRMPRQGMKGRQVPRSEDIYAEAWNDQRSTGKSWCVICITRGDNGVLNQTVLSNAHCGWGWSGSREIKPLHSAHFRFSDFRDMERRRSPPDKAWIRKMIMDYFLAGTWIYSVPRITQADVNRKLWHVVENLTFGGPQDPAGGIAPKANGEKALLWALSMNLFNNVEGHLKIDIKNSKWGNTWTWNNLFDVQNNNNNDNDNDNDNDEEDSDEENENEVSDEEGEIENGDLEDLRPQATQTVRQRPSPSPSSSDDEGENVAVPLSSEEGPRSLPRPRPSPRRPEITPRPSKFLRIADSGNESRSSESESDSDSDSDSDSEPIPKRTWRNFWEKVERGDFDTSSGSDSDENQ